MYVCMYVCVCVYFQGKKLIPVCVRELVSGPNLVNESIEDANAVLMGVVTPTPAEVYNYNKPGQ